MSDETHLDPNKDNFVGNEDDQSSEAPKDLSCAGSKSQIQAVNWNTSPEHHRNPTVPSEQLGQKRKNETTLPDSKKTHTVLSSTKQQQSRHFSIAGTPSNPAESSISRASIIRLTRDEPQHISCPPASENATAELINETEGNVPASSTLNSCDETHTRDEPQHISCPSTSENATQELIHETEDNVPPNTSDEAHVQGPSHFICDVCGKCFLLKSELDQHYAIHSEDKFFSCRFCDEKFSYKPSLSKHLQTHSGQNVHKCDQCPKVYNRKDSLESHYRVHTGEMPYSCEKCGMRFSDLSNANSHRKYCKSLSKAD